MKRLVFLILYLCSSSAFGLSLRFDKSHVIVSGATPGGSVVLYGWLAEDIGGLPLLARPSMVLLDEDRDSTVTFEYQRPMPPASLWVAIDIETAGMIVGAARGFVPQTLSFGDKSLRAGLDQIDVRNDWLDVLVVRPRTGAWYGRATEGGPMDSDGTPDSRLRINVRMLSPIGNARNNPGPLIAGDIVVLVDPLTLRYFTTVVSN